MAEAPVRSRQGGPRRPAQRRHNVTTQFETRRSEAPPIEEEHIGIEAEVTTEPPRPARWPRRARIAGMVLGSITVSLAATAFASRLFRGRQLVRARGRRRAVAIRIQPRVAIFAPTLTVSLPFSAIAGRPAPGRNRVGRNRAGRAGQFPWARGSTRRSMRGRARQMRRIAMPWRSAPRARGLCR